MSSIFDKIKSEAMNAIRCSSSHLQRLYRDSSFTSYSLKLKKLKIKIKIKKNKQQRERKAHGILVIIQDKKNIYWN